MRKTVSLKKGLNLNLAGGLGDDAPVVAVTPSRIAIVPDDFPGFTPKLDVAEGDCVVAGTPLLHDKSDSRVKLVSPVGGTVEAVVRGARRKIERVVVKTDAASSGTADSFGSLGSANGEALRTALMESGLWAMMRRRPYDIVPLPSDEPRSIMVTAMDTAPLALSLEKMVAGCETDIKAGVKALKKLTSGTIYIGVGVGSAMPDIEDAEIVEFPHIHPAGNAGVQIANIEPVNKGEVVWTLDIVTLARIGHLISTGSVDWSVSVAVTGSELVTPKIVKTVAGADMADVIGGDIKEDSRHHRVISGNVLTGVPVGTDGFLRYPYRQVTVIPEGGRRAMIMSGEYDKVFPMDILPEYLIKAIIAKDIDRMEALGIYEVAPEDFALAEYVDPSKLELQKIVRDGLDYLRSEV